MVAAVVEEHGVPCTPLGVVGGSALEVRDRFSIPLDELRAAWTGTLPALFGTPEPEPVASVELEIEVPETEVPETEVPETEVPDEGQPEDD